MTPRPADWLAIIALGLIWGSSFMAAKVALSDFGPITIAAGRIVLGAALLLAVVAVTGRDMPKGARSWAHTILFGLFSNALPFFLLNWAQQTVTSSFAGIAQATVPLFVLPLALILVPGERFAWYKLAGLVVGFFGVVLLIGPTELLSGPSAAVPRLACIAAALCYAIGSIVTRLAPPTDQIGYSASALAVAAVLTVPAALMFEGTPDVPSLRGGLSLYCILLLARRRLPPSFSSAPFARPARSLFRS